MRIGPFSAGLGLALVLVGCTPSPAPSPDGSAAPSAPTGPIDPGTADPPTASMAEQTTNAANYGGTYTVTLRSVQAQGGVMTVRYAVRWDNDDKPDTEKNNLLASGFDTQAMTVTDTAGLKLYRPFCERGSWKSDDASARDDCHDTAYVSAPMDMASRLVNHGTLEISALLPAPEGKPATVVVTPADGLPTFTDAKVTYLP